MSYQITSPTPSVQLPEEIDRLWAQLENELERVDQDGAEGAMMEVIIDAPAGEVANDHVSLEDSYNDDFCAVNADAASMDTYTAAHADEAQFAVPVLTATETTTVIADSLEELYPYRHLMHNKRRYIARQIQKTHVNDLPPVPDHFRADNFKQALDWTRGKAIPKW